MRNLGFSGDLMYMMRGMPGSPLQTCNISREKLKAATYMDIPYQKKTSKNFIYIITITSYHKEKREVGDGLRCVGRVLGQPY